MRRPIRFALGNVMASTFWLTLWLGSLVMAFRMFRLKLPSPITFGLAFALWCLLVAAPIVALATLMNRTKEGLRLAGLCVLLGTLLGLMMLIPRFYQ
jgi:hypothetical protein